MRGWRAAVVALTPVALAGCGSATRGQDYSPRQVKAAFASQGISLHSNTNISFKGAYWLATRDQGPGGPSVIAVVITGPSAGQFSYQQSKGSRARLKRLGDVRVVWTKKALDTRVEAALGKLGRGSAPAQPRPATTTSQAQPTSFAQTLAEIPAPLRAAVRKTAAAPSAHVTMTGGEITGSGDYSTVTQIGELHTKAFCIEGDEILDGTTMYTRGSFPGRRTSKKWARQDLPADASAAVSNGWPRAQLLTFVPPLGFLTNAGRVSNLGGETIDGVATTHYQTQIAGFRKGLPASALPGMGEIDVWVDKRDGYIRRAQLDIAAVETVDLSRFGEHVHVKIPPAGQIVAVSPGKEKVTVSSIGVGGCAKP